MCNCFRADWKGEQFKSKRTGMGRRREGVEIDEIVQKLFMDNTSKELKTLDMGNIASFEVACQALSLSQGIALLGQKVIHDIATKRIL